MSNNEQKVSPAQWESLSKWSAPDAAKCNDDDAPWLHLSHEHDKYDEFIELDLI